VNEDAIKSAFKKLVDDNKAALVAGLAITKQILQITKSVMTPAEVGICVATIVTDVDEWYDTSLVGANVRRQAEQAKNKKCRYSMELHVSDWAAPVSGEKAGTATEPFETADTAFNTVADRMVKMLRDNPNVPPVSGSYKIEVFDEDDESRRIRRSNHHYRSTAGGNRETVFYSIIRFTAQTCGEPNP
jgi:hypothetical protein